MAAGIVEKWLAAMKRKHQQIAQRIFARAKSPYQHRNGSANSIARSSYGSF
jgi:hypothetical protein